MFRFLPEQASEHAPHVDWLNNLITDLSVLFTVLIVGAMLYFAIKYRKRGGVDHPTPRIEGNHLLEVIWTVVPTLVCIYIAYYGIVYYFEIRKFPNPNEPHVEIQVRGQKWKWDFEYEYEDAQKQKRSKKTTAELVVPVNQQIKLVMMSNDVLHSFFIPAMRVKKDAIPGHFTWLTFKPVKTGEYQVFCTEYCGKDHSMMLAKLKVLPEAEYLRWLNDRSDEMVAEKQSPSERGKILYSQKGCNSCHSLDGSRLVGPSFLKIYGRKATCDSGKEYVADEEYIRHSILAANDQIVDGYPPNLMPAFAGQLTDAQIGDLIAFMKTLTGEPKPAAAAAVAPSVDLSKMSPLERGKWVYETNLCHTCHSIDGSKMTGPSFKGSWGQTHEMADGSKVVVDAAYLTESVRNPTAKVVKDYPPAMPMIFNTPGTPNYVSDDDLKGLVEYVRSLK